MMWENHYRAINERGITLADALWRLFTPIYVSPGDDSAISYRYRVPGESTGFLSEHRDRICQPGGE